MNNADNLTEHGAAQADVDASLSNRRDWKYHADRINAAWIKQVPSILETGRYLVEGRAYGAVAMTDVVLLIIVIGGDDDCHRGRRRGGRVGLRAAAQPKGAPTMKYRHYDKATKRGKQMMDDTYDAWRRSHAPRGFVKLTKEQITRLSDDQLEALTDDEFWGAIEPEGVCPGCDDPRLVAEARRRNERGRGRS